MLADSNADEVHKRLELHKLDSMLALCEQVNCRRQALLSYFSDQLDQPCNNCDTCLEVVETWDGTIVAQQALSCIYRTGQRFGVGYLIDVLRGKVNDRIKSSAHDKQSTFGIGKELDEQQWSSVFRQLVARNLVSVNFDHYSVLQLTDACRPILRGEQQLMLRKDSNPVKDKGRKNSNNKLVNKTDINNDIWDALRVKRREIADAQDVPPYIIFNDATLMAMVEAKPTNRHQMALISGVGERKLTLYADQFLAVLSKHMVNIETPETVKESVNLYKLGYSVEKIAKTRSIKEDTVYNHFSYALEQGIVQLNEVIELPEREINQIEDAILSLPNAQRNALKPVYELFESQYSYGILRCVRSALQFQTG
jgi:ATP-dependent DNA helicase RecQ